MTVETKKTSAPPAYNTLRPSDGLMDAIEARWERGHPTAWKCRCKPACKMKGSCFKHFNVQFAFQPKILQSTSIKRFLRNRKTQPSWRAVFFLQARNVPRLMRHGFFWSPQNIVDGNTRIIFNMESSPPRLNRSFSSQWGWTLREGLWLHTRSYHLKDISPEPQWAGCLVVYGKKPSTVANFDIGSIGMESTVWAYAIDPDRNSSLVYDTRGGPNASFNTIYDTMPLDGWWPWPKAPEVETKKRTAMGVEKTIASRMKARVERQLEMIGVP